MLVFFALGYYGHVQCTLAPAIIYPRIRIQPQLCRLAPPGPLTLAWMTREYFLILKHFLDQMSCSIEYSNIRVLLPFSKHTSVRPT